MPARRNLEVKTKLKHIELLLNTKQKFEMSWPLSPNRVVLFLNIFSALDSSSLASQS